MNNNATNAPIAKASVGLMLSLLTAACANQEPSMVPPPLGFQRSDVTPPGATLQQSDGKKPAQSQSPLPTVPPLPERPVEQAPKPSPDEKAETTLSFDQVPLPQFIQVVYGSILKRNFSIDPQIQARQDLVTIRTSQPQKPTEVAETARMLLRTYGVAVIESGGFYRIVPDSGANAYAAEVRRGRALPDTPLPMRPVFYYLTLQALRTQELDPMLKQVLGTRVTTYQDAVRNGLLLSGQSSDIRAALEVIQVLDQPVMQGRVSTRLNPVFWSADEFAKKLSEVLQAEGYNVGTTFTGTLMPVQLLVVPEVNSIIVFGDNRKTIEHVIKWASELDQASSSRGGGYFMYPVKYTDAQELAKTIQSLLGGGVTSTGNAAAGGQAAHASNRVVVDANTNSLIFQGTSEEYTRWIGLLHELDQPTKTALIEVTVAEVSLNDQQKLGVEWTLNSVSGSGTIVASTLGQLGLASAGLTLKSLDGAGNTRAVLDALATSTKSHILSRPSIMARNGETANIQVGTEVPTINSQQTTNSTTTSSSGASSGVILQQISYRSTGIILNVKPVIHGGDRIELDVSQEVSNVDPTTPALSGSPAISTRRLSTKLSMRDGATVLLGGLMSQNKSYTDTGVPLLKDIPLVGNLFKSKGDTDDKTELLVMITPYIIHDDVEAQSITEAYRGRLGSWAGSTAPIESKATSISQTVAPETTSTVGEAVITEAPSEVSGSVPVSSANPLQPMLPLPIDASQGALGGKNATPAPSAIPSPAVPSTPGNSGIPAAPGSHQIDPAALEQLKMLLPH